MAETDNTNSTNNTDKPKKNGRVGRPENLIPASKRSPEERREWGRKGGLKTQEVLRKKRDAKEIMQTLLDCKVSEALAKEKLGDMAKFLPEGATLFDLISLRQIIESGEGSPKAFEVVRDTAGYKPVERQEISAEIMTDADRDLLEKVAKRTGAKAPEEP